MNGWFASKRIRSGGAKMKTNDIACSVIVCDRCKRRVGVERINLLPGHVLCWRCLVVRTILSVLKSGATSVGH